MSRAPPPRPPPPYLRGRPTETRNHALENIARALETEQAPVLTANEADYRDAEADGIDAAFLDRLLLTSGRLNDMATLTSAGSPL